MSDTSGTEQDLALKLRMMRFFWHLGYDVRKNVGVQELWYDQKTRYTDIDVLGFKIDEELSPHFVVCDCKSGATNETRQRLFWLSGVMKYFGVQRAYFVRTKMMSSRYMELADSLGILPISEDQIAILEKAYSVRTVVFGPFCKEHAVADKVLRQLKKAPRVYDYVQTGYWEEPPQKQIISLVSCCNAINEITSITNKELDFLLSYMLSALTLSILRFAQRALVVPPIEQNDFIRLALLGGKIEFEEKKVLLGSFYGFMTREIETRYRAKYPVSSTQFRDSLVPEFAKYLVDLVTRICQKPRNYLAAPRMLSLLAFESILNDRDTPEEFVKLGYSSTDLPEAVFATKDFIVFATRSGLISSDTAKVFDEKISKIGFSKR